MWTVFQVRLVESQHWIPRTQQLSWLSDRILHFARLMTQPKLVTKKSIPVWVFFDCLWREMVEETRYALGVRGQLRAPIPQEHTKTSIYEVQFLQDWCDYSSNGITGRFRSRGIIGWKRNQNEWFFPWWLRNKFWSSSEWGFARVHQKWLPEA